MEIITCRGLCSIFEELLATGRLAIIQRKQLCQFCFRHPDNKPRPSQSQPACHVMDHKMLHDALQGEEVRAVMIEVDLEPSEDKEENFAADFEEDYGHGYDDEDKGEEIERDIQSLTDSEEERPRLCQQKVTLEVGRDIVTMHRLYD